MDCRGGRGEGGEGRRGRCVCLLSWWIWAMLVSDSSAGGSAPSYIQPLPSSLYGQRDVNTPPESRLLHQSPQIRSHARSLPVPAGSSPHLAVSTRHLVTMFLGVDVRRLNVSLLRWFREGVAASLGVAVGNVHIHHLNEKKNGIELFVLSDWPAASEPRPAEDVLQSLNVRELQRHLQAFSITEVSTQLHSSREFFNTGSSVSLLFFLLVFIIVITSFMVFYRLKEKGCNRHQKAPPPNNHLTSPTRTNPAYKPRGTKVVLSGRMVQAELPPAVATPVPQQPIPACHGVAPPIFPLSSAPSNNQPFLPPTVVPVTNELRPSPTPYRMKAAAGLQERRGSNVSLVLDMSALGTVEPLSVAVVTPREAAARDFLLSASRPLTRRQLQDVVKDRNALHSEFSEIPMNLVDPAELDVPNHGTKDRYRTVLPNPHSRVILKTKNHNDPQESYINANYIQGYHGDEKAFIATQGPMVNTVNDFWRMVWQENSPTVVMITKLKERNEKCVLYLPEVRGIYGSVEVLVNDIRESEHYISRKLTLKCGGVSRPLTHHWFSSWPDQKTPDSALPLLQLVEELEATPPGPVIVHCSAGIGRTGCFIATTIGCRQLKGAEPVDVLRITCQLRTDRGGMIQTAEQYEFVHYALSLFESRLPDQSGQ